MARATTEAERDLSLLGIFCEEINPRCRLPISCRSKLWPHAVLNQPSILGDGLDDVSMLKPARGNHEHIAAEIIVAQIADQVVAAHGLERFRSSGDWPAQSLIRPEGGIEQLLDLVLWFVQIHRNFFFDDSALFADVLRRESGEKQHIHEDIQ